MPHSTFKGQVTQMESGKLKCPCGQTFTFASERDRKMKMRLHDKSCDKGPSLKTMKRPRKAMTLKEYESMKAERRREFNKKCS